MYVVRIIYFKDTIIMASTNNKSLEDFKSQFYLTKEEKEYRLSTYKVDLDNGDIDIEMIKYVDGINSIPNFCTTQCCCGHNGDKDRVPHIDFRTNLDFKILWNNLFKNIIEEFGCTIELMGSPLNMPRYVIWMSVDSWEDCMNSLIEYMNLLMKKIKGDEG